MIVRAQVQQPFDSPAESGMESSHPQGAESTLLLPSRRKFNETRRQDGRAVIDEQTRFVRHRLTDGTQASARPPDQRMPPQQCRQRVDETQPERITSGEMGEFVGQHHVLPGGRLDRKVRRQCNGRPNDSVGNRAGQLWGDNNPDRAHQSEKP
jgi:hypothetical protein